MKSACVCVCVKPNKVGDVIGVLMKNGKKCCFPEHSEITMINECKSHIAMGYKKLQYIGITIK